jgi:hypothetical protein
LALVAFEVEGETAFIAVGREEVGGLSAFGEGWSPMAGVVAASGGFDLDDVGTKIAEELGAVRTSQNASEVEDADTV